MNPFEEFISPEPNSGCWLWTGASSHGYGAITVDGKVRGAHRVVFEALRGPIPAGLQLDHLCRNPACVNPDHLEPVTGKVNTLRGVGPTALNAAMDVCSRGHPFDSVRRIAGKKYRACRECLRLRNREWKRAKAAKDGHWPKRGPQIRDRRKSAQPKEPRP